MKNVTLFLLVVSSFFANAQFEFSGQIRPRLEVANGNKTLSSAGQEASAFVLQRTRLNLTYSKDIYQTHIVFQDVRIWGSQSQLVMADGLTTINQAWFKLRLDSLWDVKVGRQPLSYDDQRILGGTDWAQQARSHDVALLRYDGKTKFHLGAAYNQNSTSYTNNNYTVANSYKTFQFIWLNRSFGEDLNVSFLLLNNGIGETVIKHSQTIGLHANYKKGKFNAMGTFYQQAGKDGNNKDLNAQNVKLELGYKLTQKLKINAGFEHLSGQNNYAGSSSNKSFTPFYGTNHRYNGHMDYFFVGNFGNSVGLNDIYFRAPITISEKAKLIVAGHHFLSASKFNDGVKTFDSNLGSEIDLVFKYKIKEDVNLAMGYSQLVGTETLEAIKGSPAGSYEQYQGWTWVMISVNPTFFKK